MSPTPNSAPGPNPSPGPDPSSGLKPSPFGDLNFGGQPEAKAEIYQNAEEVTRIETILVNSGKIARGEIAFRPEKASSFVDERGVYLTERTIYIYTNEEDGCPFPVYPGQPEWYLLPTGLYITDPNRRAICAGLYHEGNNRNVQLTDQDLANLPARILCEACRRKEARLHWAFIMLSLLGAIGFFAGWHLR